MKGSPIKWRAPASHTVKGTPSDQSLIEWCHSENVKGAIQRALAKRVGCSVSVLSIKLREYREAAKHGDARTPGSRRKEGGRDGAVHVAGRLTGERLALYLHMRGLVTDAQEFLDWYEKQKLTKPMIWNEVTG